MSKKTKLASDGMSGAANSFHPGFDALFKRFEEFGVETRAFHIEVVKEVCALEESFWGARVKWWSAYTGVHGIEGLHLLPFFKAWFLFGPVPEGNLKLPCIMYPFGLPDSPGYFIEKWDWLANSSAGLKLNMEDPTWRTWFKDFLDLRGEYLKTKASWPEDLDAAWTLYGGTDEHPFNIKKYRVPVNGFETFDDFFLRWVENIDEERPVGYAGNPLAISAPADGGVFYLARDDSDPNARHRLPGKSGDTFNLIDTFGEKYGSKFVGGPLLDTLLWFTDFHHFFAPVSGKLLLKKEIDGSYNYDFDNFDANNTNAPPPPSGSDRVDWYNHLGKHKRYLWVFDTEQLGIVGMCAVGFWGVGSIKATPEGDVNNWAGGSGEKVVQEGDQVSKGQYLGHFGYGGSSIVLAFQPRDGIEDLVYDLQTVDGVLSNADLPRLVLARQSIGFAKRVKDGKQPAPAAVVGAASNDEPHPGFENLFKRFEALDTKTLDAHVAAVKEVCDLKEEYWQSRVSWWTAYGTVHGTGNLQLEAFFKAWCLYGPKPEGELQAPSSEKPQGSPDGPGYFIERWDWLANTSVGLKLNMEDKAWRIWFRDFLNLRGDYLKTKTSWPKELGDQWANYGGTDAHPFSLKNYYVPENGFPTFNHFFLRWVNNLDEDRPLKHKHNPLAICAPADGGVFYLARDDSDPKARYKLPGKSGDTFNLVETFGKKYGNMFIRGPLLDTLLWFTDFHHFFAPVSGVLVAKRQFQGSYNYDFDAFDPEHHGEAPPDSGSDRVDWYNHMGKHKRCIWVFKTEKLGFVGMCAVGFWGVGSIVTNPRGDAKENWAGGSEAAVLHVGDRVEKGQYLGHFGYGGSSIALAFQPHLATQDLIYNFETADGKFQDADKPTLCKARQTIGFARLK